MTISRRITALISGVAFIGGVAIAEATEKTLVILDGTWWRTQTYVQKVAAVQGMSVGFYSGYETARTAFAELMISALGEHCYDQFCYDWSRDLERVPVEQRTALKEMVRRNGKRLTLTYTATIGGALHAAEPVLAGRSFALTVANLDAAIGDSPRMSNVDVSRFVRCATANGEDCGHVVSSMEK